MTSDERWLAANWPFVHAWLPAAPARVLEIGCGPRGGFVSMMQAAGYQATGVDPEAPPGLSYRQVEFERYEAPGQLDAIVACTSLHHVADLPAVLDLAVRIEPELREVEMAPIGPAEPAAVTAEELAVRSTSRLSCPASP